MNKKLISLIFCLATVPAFAATAKHQPSNQTYVNDSRNGAGASASNDINTGGAGGNAGIGDSGNNTGNSSVSSSGNNVGNSASKSNSSSNQTQTQSSSSNSGVSRSGNSSNNIGIGIGVSNGSSSRSGVSNAGNSSNTNSNSANGGSATGGAGGTSSAGSSISEANTTTYKEVRQAATAYAPDSLPSAPCRVAGSAGASSPFGGVSLGGSKLDKDCDDRETARAFALLGNKMAAARILCDTRAAKKAQLTFQECANYSNGYIGGKQDGDGPVFVVPDGQGTVKGSIILANPATNTSR